MAERSGSSPEEVDPDRPLEEFGLASRDAVAIAGELEELLDRSLNATLVWEYPTINRLVRGLLGVPDEDAAPAGGERTAEPGEAVAVIGLGCRFPGGVTGPESYWDLLVNGREAVGEVPEGRWDAFDDGSPEVAELLTTVTRRGGFLDDVAGFDAAFFGITPTEAAAMDPQQRMLLEVAWQALEHAGIAPPALRGSRTGTFVGISATEYAYLTASDLTRVEAWTATGAAMSIAANRLSYLMDLRGPSLAVDTACSSSLVATHLAVRSLLAGESDLALAGGVNVLLSPMITMTFDRAGGTSPDGRTKAFDAAADGMVRAEGCGVVVLKRLSDALRDGDRVLAVIRNTAVNQDGRSNGLVAPNPEAQEALLREAYRGIDPASVDYVEAHGTGTLLGDPIEARALDAVLGRGRDPRRPLLLGSAKTNLGHMEPAAGAAGLIKTVLALARGVVPPSLNFGEPSPHIPWDHLKVVTEPTPWPSARPRAGVSSFGFGGTNAHVVLERAEPLPPAPPYGDRTLLFPLSDVTADRIAAHARDLADWIEEREDVPLADVAHTLARRYGRGRARAVIAARDRGELVERLRAYPEGAVTGAARALSGPVWVFSGYGSQWAGMGRGLYRDEPVFREAIDELEPLFAAETGHSLREIVETGREVRGVAEVQPVIFAIQVALARLWRSYGVAPAAVLGHSMGEVAAAVVAGGLSLADGVKVIVRRARLLGTIGGGGAMAVLEIPADEVPDGLHVAVYAAPRQTVVTGDPDRLAELAREVEARGLLARLLTAEGAGHSPQVDPLLPALAAELAEIIGREPETAFYSTVTPGETPAFDAAYWAANARRPVRFLDAVRRAAEAGHTVFVEVSPHPLVAYPLGEIVPGALVTHSLKRGAGEAETFHGQRAVLHANGLPLAIPGRIADVPSPRWRHERHWAEGPRRDRRPDTHPLLGAHVELPGEERHVWQGVPALTGFAGVHGVEVLPLAAVAEMALAAASRALGRDDLAVTDAELTGFLPLTGDTLLTTSLVPGPRGSAEVEIQGRDAAGAWTRYGTAVVAPYRPADRPSPAALAELEAATRDAVSALDAGTVRTLLAAAPGAGGPGAGGPGGAVAPRIGSPPPVASATPPVAVGAGTPPAAFDPPAAPGPFGPPVAPGALAPARQQAGPPPVAERVSEAEVTVEAPEPATRSPYFRAHPLVLDACLRALHPAAVPMSAAAVRVHGDCSRGGLCRTRVGERDGRLIGELTLSGPDGTPLLTVTGVELREVEPTRVPVPLAGKLFELAWLENPLPETPETLETLETPETSRAWLVVTGDEPPDLVNGLDRAILTTPEALATALDARPGVAGVVLPVPAGRDDPAAAEELVLTAAKVARTLAGSGSTARLWFAARGDSLAAAALRGLVRVLAFEHPALRATLVRVEEPGQLAAELRADAVQDEVAWRSGARFTGHLAAATLGDPVDRHVVRRGGGYVITGGYGGLGLVVARRLAERGAGRVVLGGRSGPPPEAEKLIAEIREHGAEVEVVTGDIAADGTAERLVAAAIEGGVRLCGVVHAAGLLADRLVADLGEEDLRRVWLPKAYGAWRLHEATLGHDLDWWVAFSSAAALLGSPGQASYAAANAWLDALVARRRALGLPATTINWGTWADVGGAADNPMPALQPITPAEGAEALEALLQHDRAATGVVRLDAAAAVAFFPEIREMPFFSALMGPAAGPGETGDAWPGPAGLREMPSGRARELASERLRARAAAVLGFEPGRLDADVPLTDLGLDSLIATRIRNTVEHDFAVAVPPPLLLKGGTLRDLERFVADGLGLGEAAAAAAPPDASPTEDVLVDARDAAERQALRVFRDVLGRPVSVTDAVLDAGTAATVAERLSAEIGHRLDPGDVLRAASAEAVAGLVRAFDEAEAAQGLVRRLRTRGTGRPFFCAHPAGGTTGQYRQLAELVGDGQPFYGLERIEDDVLDVKARAARYVPEILAAQPAGPYRLGGWSFGGVLAYEIAVQLTALGHHVELVAMLDSGLPLPISADEASRHLSTRIMGFADYLSETYGKPVRLTLDELLPLDEDAKIELVMARAGDAGLLDSLTPAILRHQQTSHEDTRALERYRPEPYDGRVVLYRATEPTPWAVQDPRYDHRDDARGWDAHCSRLEIVHVPGHHLNLLDPPAVQVIAEHLSGLLA
ncbi:type I polyketide synthase [Bailinhaonella thermotolerans]|uniref:type I polyketide synthase n=1 Tax=Bailinhaonella thermotolerans TaxID=1070861 RepID=UPI001F5BA0BB|nr:type I polyketide synthase [Bailinhaonella thermotolerans]